MFTKAAGITGRILNKTKLGRSVTGLFDRVGEALKTPKWGHTAWGPAAWSDGPNLDATFDLLRQDLKSFTRNHTDIINSGKTAIRATKATARFAGRMGWKLGASAYRHPVMWTIGGGIAGTAIGSFQGIRTGLRDQGYPIETRNLAPPVGGGPGYQTWVKGPNRPLSPNHLGAAGLPLALHKTRHGA